MQTKVSNQVAKMSDGTSVKVLKAEIRNFRSSYTGKVKWVVEADTYFHGRKNLGVFTKRIEAQNCQKYYNENFAAKNCIAEWEDHFKNLKDQQAKIEAKEAARPITDSLFYQQSELFIALEKGALLYQSYLQDKTRWEDEMGKPVAYIKKSPFFTAEALKDVFVHEVNLASYDEGNLIKHVGYRILGQNSMLYLAGVITKNECHAISDLIIDAMHGEKPMALECLQACIKAVLKTEDATETTGGTR